MTDTPEDWVLIKAAKRCGRCYWRIVDLTTGYRNDRVFRALCDMIAKHEQPPVDRKLLCAEEAKREMGWNKGWMGANTCVRAIELWEEGYGK